RDTTLMQRARRVADDLEAARWSSSAASARILSARLALELGHRGRARNDLRRVNAGPGSPVALRIQAHHAEALLALSGGDVATADACLKAGWDVLEQHRATLGATELRVSAAMHAIEIATLGLQLAVSGGDPGRVFDWAERVRAGALHTPPPRAPRDAILAVALAELRVAAAEADTAAKEGTDPRPALRRQAELEETIRRRAQIVPVSEGGAAPAVEAEALLADLGGHVLVEYLEVDGRLAAVVAADGAHTLRWLGESATAEREIAALRMALRRMAVRSPIPALAAAARTAAEVAAEALRRQLLEPLAAAIAGRPVVVVPAGSLHSLPWAALRGDHASLVVAPSATLWRRGQREAELARTRGAEASQAGSARGGVLLAAGPGLNEADAEIEDLASSYPGALLLDSGAATIDAVRAGLATVDLAHLACHGHFRDDNPLFSALELADGALSVFEFEDLPRVPARIVLSACDAGRSSVHPGNELLGVTAALLRLGAQSLVASTLPVPDGASRRLMTAAHRGLASGLGMSASLAQARTSVDLERDEDFVAAAAFAVLGSD
ncbi:MAG: CHAT domain-containing protein, partial [Solirubrobacteraceae bacterium]|nr:CHAT domain-containing protein [Patulibacter sp.]